MITKMEAAAAKVAMEKEVIDPAQVVEDPVDRKDPKDLKDQEDPKGQEDPKDPKDRKDPKIELDKTRMIQTVVCHMASSMVLLDTMGMDTTVAQADLEDQVTKVAKADKAAKAVLSVLLMVHSDHGAVRTEKAVAGGVIGARDSAVQVVKAAVVAAAREVVKEDQDLDQEDHQVVSLIMVMVWAKRCSADLVVCTMVIQALDFHRCHSVHSEAWAAADSRQCRSLHSCIIISADRIPAIQALDHQVDPVVQAAQAVLLDNKDQ